MLLNPPNTFFGYFNTLETHSGLICHTSDNKYPLKLCKSLYFITFVYLFAFTIKTVSRWLDFTFSQSWKKKWNSRNLHMLSCLLFEENLSNHASQLHIMEFCFLQKKISHNSLCTANAHSIKYIMVWYQIKKKFVTFHFPAQQLQKKAQKIMKFTEKYKKAMFVCIIKAGRGKIEILDKLSSYAILSKGAIFHCSISKKKANSCLPAVIGVLFNWTILSF